MVRYVLNSRAEAPRRGSHTRSGRPPGRTERGRQPPRPLCRARGYPPWERRSCCRTPRQTSRCQFLCRRQAHRRCLPRTLFRSRVPVPVPAPVSVPGWVPGLGGTPSTRGGGIAGQRDCRGMVVGRILYSWPRHPDRQGPRVYLPVQSLAILRYKVGR